MLYNNVIILKPENLTENILPLSLILLLLQPLLSKQCVIVTT